MSALNNIYWKFYPFINNKVVYLQKQICGFELTNDTVQQKYSLNVKQIDYSNEEDLETWCQIMNDSYDDCCFNQITAKSFLTNHNIFENNKTAIFFLNTLPCASVSWGGIKGAPHVGGDFRIGVRNAFKGRGLGRMCVEYAFSRLQEEGYKLGESIITIKRVPSIMLHFSLGFVPRYNMRYVSFRDNLKNINSIQRVRLTFRLYKYYSIYKRKFKESFLK